MGSQSEADLERLLILNGIDWKRTGYPDYAILNKDGEIYGFIEVKRNTEDLLADEQYLFRKFCLKNGIPHSVWYPGLLLPSWLSQQYTVTNMQGKTFNLQGASEYLIREWLIKESREDNIV